VTNSRASGAHDLTVLTTTDTAISAAFTLVSEAPPPGFDVSSVVGAVTGTVSVRLPGTRTFIGLATGARIPLGSTVDAGGGSVALVFARRGGGTMTAVFSGGEFVISQTRGGEAIATLAGGSFAACTGLGHGSLATVASRRPVRKLWSDDQPGGSFGTRGSYVVKSDLVV